jgi:hypothetical protein
MGSDEQQSVSDGSEEGSPAERSTETAWESAAQWISRTLATALLMVIPGILGSLADKRLGTGFLAPIGFAIGLAAGTAGLLVLVKRLSPPARGKPLPFSDGESDDGETSKGGQDRCD